MLHELNGGGAWEHIPKKTNKLSCKTELVLPLVGAADHIYLDLPFVHWILEMVSPAQYRIRNTVHLSSASPNLVFQQIHIMSAPFFVFQSCPKTDTKDLLFSKLEF